jgi:periplasmic divalent cation tolerance protein
VDEIADVSVTAASADWLADFARAVVTDRLAACGNIVPQIRSIYRSEGAIEDEGEALVVFHTRASLVPELIERVNQDHPYDTPQVLAVPVMNANPGYQQWVITETREPKGT